MLKYQLYVGANNVTKKVDYETLHKVVGGIFEGYTVTDAIGVWKGVRENACIVTIFESNTMATSIVVALAKELCVKLDQYCILVEVDGKGVMVDNPSK